MLKLPWKKHVQAPVKTIEMILDHDGSAWLLSGGEVCVRAASLDELDRRVEKAMAAELGRAKRLRIFMACNNEIIPKWIRPYMNHYFNRILELPLRGR